MCYDKNGDDIKSHQNKIHSMLLPRKFLQISGSKDDLGSGDYNI